MANQITIDILANTRGLTAGVKEVNSQLSSLNQAAGKVKAAFGGLAAAFGFQIGTSFLKDAVKGALEDQKAFQRVGELFGKDAEKITNKINNLASTWFIDDGEIAQYFVKLKSAFSSQFDKFVPDVTEAAIVLSKLTGKPLEEVINTWTKTLRDGKITAQEVQKLGVDLTKDQEQQFNKLKTTSERLQFILDILLGPENRKAAQDLISPLDKWNAIMERIKDTIGNFVLPQLDKLSAWFSKLTPQQQDQIVKWGAIVTGVLAASAAVAPFVIVLDALIGVFKALKVAQAAATVAQLAYNAALAINPFVGIITAILALIMIGVLLWKNWDTIKAKFNEFITAFKAKFGEVVKFFQGIGATIKTVVGNLFEMGKKFGSDIINGLVQGIKAMAMAPINAIKGVISGVKSAVTSFFKIGSPSKLFAGYGKNLVEGLAIGIDRAQNLALGSMSDLSSSLMLTPSFAGTSSRGAVNITINAGVGTDPYELGRVVRAALNKYDGVNGR